MSEPKNFELKEGEKYLTIHFDAIKVSDLLKGVVAVFPNTEGREKNKAAPHFKGNGVSVWVNKKKAGTEKTQEEIL